jgi:hypothetical protein
MPDKGPKRHKPVARADLFAFRDTAGVVANGDLVNAIAETANFGGQFGAEFKTL